MHKPPLIVAAVAVLMMAVYMFFAYKDVESIEKQHTYYVEKIFNGKIKAYAECVGFCAATFSLPGQKDQLNICVANCPKD